MCNIDVSLLLISKTFIVVSRLGVRISFAMSKCWRKQIFLLRRRVSECSDSAVTSVGFGWLPSWHRAERCKTNSSGIGCNIYMCGFVLLCCIKCDVTRQPLSSPSPETTMVPDRGDTSLGLFPQQVHSILPAQRGNASHWNIWKSIAKCWNTKDCRPQLLKKKKKKK